MGEGDPEIDYDETANRNMSLCMMDGSELQTVTMMAVFIPCSRYLIDFMPTVIDFRGGAPIHNLYADVSPDYVICCMYRKILSQRQ